MNTISLINIQLLFDGNSIVIQLSLIGNQWSYNGYSIVIQWIFDSKTDYISMSEANK